MQKQNRNRIIIFFLYIILIVLVSKLSMQELSVNTNIKNELSQLDIIVNMEWLLIIFTIFVVSFQVVFNVNIIHLILRVFKTRVEKLDIYLLVCVYFVTNVLIYQINLDILFLVLSNIIITILIVYRYTKTINKTFYIISICLICDILIAFIFKWIISLWGL